MFRLGPAEFIIILVMIIPLLAVRNILTKAGYNGALGLLLFVPPLGAILICYLGFNKWPIEKRIEELEKTS